MPAVRNEEATAGRYLTGLPLPDAERHEHTDADGLRMKIRAVRAETA